MEIFERGTHEFTRKQWVMLAPPVVLVVTRYVAFQRLVATLGYPLG